MDKMIPVDASKAVLLAKMLDARTWPDDDGMSEVVFMQDNHLTVDEFVALGNELDRLRKALREGFQLKEAK